MIGSSLAQRAAILAPVLTVLPQLIGAQTVFHACYVPATGIVYRIDEGDVCKGSSHVRFTWTDAAGADHGALVGLDDDDHSLYLLKDGVRDATDGFAVTGTFGSGEIPAEGDGHRLMWYPGKAAFRVGGVRTPSYPDPWDKDNIGDYSTAMGLNAVAKGYASAATGNGALALGNASIAMGTRARALADASTAIGHNAIAQGLSSTAIGIDPVASGGSSMALGHDVRASGENSTALGSSTEAGGRFATAMGFRTVANGEGSTVMGSYASDDGKRGSFVYGDAATLRVILAPVPNSFTVRASGGATFYSDVFHLSGVSLASGGGAWSSVSDRNRKREFRDESGEGVLEKIAEMPIQSWSYLSQDPSVRHLGPVAQDFYAAFGLGDSDLTITTSDISGVNILAIQALETRTTELRGEVATLKAENDELRSRLVQVEAMLLKLMEVRR